MLSRHLVLHAVFCFHGDSQLVVRDPEKNLPESRRIADTVPGDVVMVSGKAALLPKSVEEPT